MFALFMSLMAAAQAAPSPAVEPMRFDGKGRPMIAATIDGKGPVDVIIDTAAGSTIIRDESARALGLAQTPGERGVVGVAGRATARVYRVGSFASRLFDLRGADLPGVPSIGVTQAQAIAGVDLFETRRLVFDGIRGQIRTEESGPTPAGFVAVRGEYVPGEGLIVPIRINDVEIRALIDTGAEGTVAGRDVLRALGWEDDDPRLAPFGQISGAAAGASAARVAAMDTVKLGPVTARGVRIVFADGLGAEPSSDGKPVMIVGLDVLKALQVYALDFPRGELQMQKMPAAGAR